MIDGFTNRQRLTLLSPKQIEALRIVSAGMFYPCLAKEEDGWHARWHAVSGDNGWVDEYVRRASMTRLTEDAEDQRHETLHDAWIAALRSVTGLVRWDDAECRAFAADLEEWAGAADEDVEARRSVEFSLVPRDGAFRIECAVPRGRRRLKALGQATYVWGALRGLRREPGRDDAMAVTLSRQEAEDFTRNGARALVDAGYTVSGLPPSATVLASAEFDGGEKAPSPESRVGCVKLTVRVAGEPVTADEIRFLLDQGSTLVFFRNRWIEVDRGILKEALRALEKGQDKSRNLVSFALGIGRIGALEVDELKAHGWLRGLVDSLRARGNAPASKAEVPGFRGTLRDYQAEGVAWMRFLTDNGFGALLADDMGLGKTIQAIAWMLVDRETEKGGRGTANNRPVLVVAPLTLLSNWRHELAKFAPSLKVYMHHGDARRAASGFHAACKGADVVLTNYSLLTRECSSFAEIAWSALVLDEAQIAKNPATQIARAVRAISPSRRMALTGTPVENSPDDIWALEDFLNPGFLGDLKSFRERFTRPMALDPSSSAAKKLRRALEPCVLRRLKSDPRIAAELGEKREIREYCELDAWGRGEYERALADFRATTRSQGDALALLTSLKLICDGFRADVLDPSGGSISPESGKFLRLCDLLEQIFAGGESALVFTQYAKVGAALGIALEKRFGRRFPFLHGSLSAAEREREISKFRIGARANPTAFLLSLKAGGFGLNLTKATHVVHFDRCWNPAVEAQATDRAHRIGQTEAVFVHLMISSGTVEDRVDEILSRKESLRSVLADGAAFWKAVSLAPDGAGPNMAGGL